MQILKLFIFLNIFLFCFAFDPSTYPNNQELIPNQYTIYWRVEGDTIYIAIQAHTTGWVGFGIGEWTSGSMPGSDIIVGSVVNGVGSVTDRYAYDFVMPAQDDCQDWQLVASDESNGVTTIEAKRLLKTGDSQDREIVVGENRVVAAFGTTDDLSYHNGNRITSVITFFGSAAIPPLPSDVLSKDFQVANYLVPDGQTHYVCQSFALPIDQQYHIVRVDPIVNQSNVQHVHHYLTHICSNMTGGYVEQYHQPGECVSPLGDIAVGCTSLMTAWAAGGDSTYLPEVAGFPLGPAPNSIQFIVLEIHYNNPDFTGGYVDNSGFRIWYTPTLRQYDAAMFTLGDPFINFAPIPPLAITEYEAECPTICSNTVPYDLNIIQSFPHMHQIGSEIWTTQWRDGVQIAELGRVEYWSFDHQQSVPVNFTLKAGDRFNTHCIYNAMSKSAPTTFGIASTQEMCMHFLTYYPRIIQNGEPGFTFCGFLNDTETICGPYVAEDMLEYDNPTIRDPPGAANKTFGADPGTCSNSPVGSSGSQAGSSDSHGSSASFIKLSFVLYFAVILSML